MLQFREIHVNNNGIPARVCQVYLRHIYNPGRQKTINTSNSIYYGQ